MQYTIETIIEKSLEEVLEQFHTPSNYMKWMPGITSYRKISDHQREAGSKSIFEFTMNGKDFTIEETIVKNDMREIIAEYISSGTLNVQTTVFSKIDQDKTRYSVNEAFKLKGFMKVIGLLMPGSFKKQTKKFVEAFKNFVENRE
ncbi:MAG: SRPBCC family protein [Bacteroidota bacterium]